MSDQQTIDQIVGRICASKKYGSIRRETVARIVSDCAIRYKGKQIEQQSRNILHQMWGAYWETRPDFKKLTASVKQSLSSGSDIREVIRSLLLLHASTNERISLLPEFYERIFSVTGTPDSIVDHACGLNPLSIVYMDLPKQATYTAYDIDIEEVSFLNDVLTLLNIPHVQVYLGDVFDTPYTYADVVFMFKLLPLLEHQRKGSSLDVLKSQKCRHFVVSYPVKSIGGAEKGMAEFYTNQFTRLIENEKWHYTRILFASELVFVVQK